jgi:hypothetical protein
VEVINIDYHDIKIDRAQNINLVSTGIHWALILIQTLNKDEDAGLSEHIYNRVYNMLVTLIVNITENDLK